MKVRDISKLEDLLAGKKILDIGCGNRKLEGAVGLDRRGHAGTDILADLNAKLPFKDMEFDGVYANQVLEHIADSAGLIYEIHRVLKPGGILLAHCPYFRSSWAHIDPTHVKSFTINSMDYFVKGAFCYENYRFRDEAFGKIEVFLDNDRPRTVLRKFFTRKAMGDPFKFENSVLSGLYVFERISYLLTK